MRTLRHAQGLIQLLLLMCLARIGAHVPSYSEYDAPTRYDNRRAQQEGRRYAGVGHRQQAAPQTLYQRPGALNFDMVDQTVAQQPRRREYLLRAHEGVSSRDQHKCRIWVP